MAPREEEEGSVGTNEALTEALIEALSALKKGGGGIEVAIARMEKDIEQHEKDISLLKKTVFDNHDPVVVWCRNFMDSYRKIATAVVISAVITLAGFLVPVYVLLHKSNAVK